MGCLEVPEPPELPDILPIVITPPTLPLPTLSADFCCHLELDLSKFIPPIPLGAVLTSPTASAIIVTINQYAHQVRDWINAQIPGCPLE